MYRNSVDSTTFFITGVSSGLGKALAEEALAAGHRVIGTVRNEDALEKFSAICPGNSLGRILDVTNEMAVSETIEQIESKIGAINVLVNNAGYGHEGTLEESSMDDLRRQFEVNVFGAVAVTKAVLPYMRKRRAGHIINITSMGGYITMPGISFYCGSKAALEAISETLGKEVKSLGIRVTAVAPGSFRTDWAGRSMVRAPRTISDYDDVFDPIRQRRQEYSGHQAGDPIKAARAILQIVESPEPPAHLLLGQDALRLVGEKIDFLRGEFGAWKELSSTTDFV